ncbi:MAG: nitrogen fixation protein NifQ [Coriobacteriia bacterium]
MSIPGPIPPARRDEFDALLGLLLEHSEGMEAPVMAKRIALACMGDQHLWRDMRLGGRAELRAIFEVNFPSLAEANDRDMRWKRFLYKRLCGWQGFDG